MNQPKNYASYALRFTLVLLLALVALSFAPPFELWRVHFKRADILSEIVDRDDVPAAKTNVDLDTTYLADYNAGMEAGARGESEVPAALSADRPGAADWTLGDRDGEANDPAPMIAPAVSVRPVEGNVVAVEDFGAGNAAMERFYSMLSDKNRKRPVRIAILGDSFIEGDIFSADLREQLQDIYGGRGVGFIPYASPFSKLKATVAHSHEHWKVVSVQHKKSLDSVLQNKFFISGSLSLPEPGVVTTLKGVEFRRHIKSASVARMLFINERQAILNVTINDSLRQRFRPAASANVQQIVVSSNQREGIGTISVSVENPEGFIGYGIIMEDMHGVSVDNYSIRGNSGLALFGTSQNINAQINRLVGYDLIILQYGLNVMSPDVLYYDSYGKNLVKIIQYMRACFPESSILVMGVGDRGIMQDGQMVTMPAVPGLIRAQRKAAETAATAFWNTFLGMGGENSMGRFVEKKWAAKDYTHLSYGGGRYIATALVKALVKGHQEHEAGRAAESQRKAVDSLARHIDRARLQIGE